MHEWPSAHEIIELWQQAALTAPPRSVFTPLLPYHQVSATSCMHAYTVQLAIVCTGIVQGITCWHSV
jgi:hypothetical protein